MSTYKIYSAHLATAASLDTDEETREMGERYRDALAAAFQDTGLDIDVELIHGVSGGESFNTFDTKLLDQVTEIANAVFERVCCEERETISGCLIGDDRSRDYPVAWRGTGDAYVSDPENDAAEIECCDAELVMVAVDDREALFAKGFMGVWEHCTRCRSLKAADGWPEMTDDRLRAAL